MAQQPWTHFYKAQKGRDERNTQGDGEWAQAGSEKGKWNTVSGRMGISATLIGPGPVGKRKAELGTENAEDSGKGLLCRTVWNAWDRSRESTRRDGKWKSSLECN